MISPDELNDQVLTVMMAPMTSALQPYPFGVNLTFQGKPRQVALDQSRAVSWVRLVRKLGTVSSKAAREVSAVLARMFHR